MHFHSFSEIQSKKSGLVAKFFRWDFKKSMLPIQRKTFGSFDQVFHQNVFASYCHWAVETFFDLWRKKFCRIVKAAPYVSRLPFGWLFEFSGKNYCFSINFRHQFRKLFPDFYRKVFSWIFRSCVPRIQRNIYRDFFRKCFLVSFGFLGH